MKLQIILALVATLAWQAGAQIYDTNNVVVQTFAGSGFPGYVDGQGMQTMFNNPASIVADSSGNLFVWDKANVRIRKITPDGTVSTFAGGGSGTRPGYGTNVSLELGASIGRQLAIDHTNTLWLTYSYGNLLRIGSDGYVSQFHFDFNGGSPPYVSPYGVCPDSGNNIYFSDSDGNKIYRYRTNGVLEVFAGSGNPGSSDGNGIFTSFYNPAALVADAANNIYVWDSGNRLIRRIDQNQNVTTFAGTYQNASSADGVGTNAGFDSVSQMCVDGFGNLILACNQSIRRISARTNVTTIAGSFSASGYGNGPGNLARFDNSSGVCVSGGKIYVADSSNQRIRQISFNPSPEAVLPADLQLGTYPGLRIVGTVGRTYQVHSSPDMSNWTTQATLLLNASPFLWIDQNPVSGNKFYRALLLP